ncbi:hypothetical protein D3C80_886200 [compost metagenome]
MARFIDVFKTNKDEPDNGKDGDNAVKQGKQIPDHRGVARSKRVQYHVTEDSHQSLSGEVLRVGRRSDNVVVGGSCAGWNDRYKQPCTKRTKEIFHSNSG